jgi:uncharacterized protein (TIGR04255 family)
MKIPIKIDPCPIAEAIIEIRFSSSFPEDAIFGILYPQLQNDFKIFEKLPILQLPEAIRRTDQNLIYQPYYKLKKDNFLILMGPRVFALVNLKEYSGWKVFSAKIIEIFNVVAKLKIVEDIKRIGLRYVNLFENLNLFDISSLTLNLRGEPLLPAKTDLTMELDSEHCTSRVKMANNALVMIEKEGIKGSLLDIDVEFKDNRENFFEDIEKFSDIAHNNEKEIFFSLLKDEYLKTLNPQY